MSWGDWAAEYLHERHTIFGGEQRTLHCQGHTWWSWEDARYKVLPKIDLTRRIAGWMRDKKHSTDFKHVEKVQHALAGLCHLDSAEYQMPCWIGPNPFDSRRDILCTRNAIVDFEGVYLGAPHPAWFSCVRAACNYEPGARCPLLLRWLEEYPASQDHRALQEFAFYFQVPRAPGERVDTLMLRGATHTGKSTLAGVFIALLGGIECVSVKPLDEFGDMTVMADLHGKALNISDETDEHWSKVEGKFKLFTGGAPVNIRQLYTPAHAAHPTAKLLLNINDWPHIKDKAGAVYSRLVCVPLTKVIPASVKDKWYGDKLAAELPGIFNWSLEGGRRLRAQGWQFSRTTGHEELERLESLNNPALAFVRECLVEKMDSFLSRAVLEDRAKVWASANKIATPPFTAWSQVVKDTLASARWERHQYANERTYGFMNVSLRP